jgi:hypothetical protein
MSNRLSTTGRRQPVKEPRRGAPNRVSQFPLSLLRAPIFDLIELTSNFENIAFT